MPQDQQAALAAPDTMSTAGRLRPRPSSANNGTDKDGHRPMRRLGLATAALLLASVPALAQPNCQNKGNFERNDGTQNASVSLAEAKARTSALFRRPSKVFADQFAAGNTGFMSFPDDARPIASEGGMPIIVNGRLIGAIGMSGGTGQQDGVASAAGANAVR